jgi:hypothetical protein
LEKLSRGEEIYIYLLSNPACHHNSSTHLCCLETFYSQLEEFLIANRSEYLRHSALNYTAEQKHFNNRLTEGLLEIAARHNYIFDESCFNFVAVRDRIRCYYKSYVQSSKKRGIVVGFSTKAKAMSNASGTE